jgi:hypothetical protein
MGQQRIEKDCLIQFHLQTLNQRVYLIRKSTLFLPLQQIEIFVNNILFKKWEIKSNFMCRREVREKNRQFQLSLESILKHAPNDSIYAFCHEEGVEFFLIRNGKLQGSQSSINVIKKTVSFKFYSRLQVICD